jgi:uncharacterized repeat protein (TIGR01451 family)
MRLVARFTRVTVLSISALALGASVHTSLAAAPPSPSLNPVVVTSRVPAPARAEEPPVEFITTYADDCSTPKTVFRMGETVCVQAGAFDTIAPRQRRFQWTAPSGVIPDRTNIKVDPQYDKFEIPTTGEFAQVGTWYASTVNVEANRVVRTKFTVRDLRLTFADLVITKWGPPLIDPGDRVRYRLRVANPGPDFAEGLEIIDEVPNDMVFLAVKQASGPAVECATPKEGETGRSLCKGKGLGPDEAVELDFYYVVSRDLKDRTSFLSKVSAFSATDELNKADNFSSHEYLITVDNGGDETVVVEDP